MSKPNSSYKLPPEVIGLIMREFRGNKATLKATSLVCKDWLSESSRILFEVLSLNLNNPHGEDWIKFLEEAPRIHNNVHTLNIHVEGTHSRVYPFGHLLQTLTGLPRLRSLELIEASLEHGPGEDDALAVLRNRKWSLTDLTIEESRNTSCNRRLPIEDRFDGALCYMRLLSAASSIGRLHISAPKMWPVDSEYQLPASQMHALARTQLLRVDTIELQYKADSPLLAWVCGTLIPDLASPIDLNATGEFIFTWSPPPAKYSSALPSILRLLRSLPCLRVLRLEMDMFEYAMLNGRQHQDAAPYAYPEFSDVLQQLALSTHTHLEHLIIGNFLKMLTRDQSYYPIPQQRMRTLWRTLMDALHNVPPRLDTIELLFKEPLDGIEDQDDLVVANTLHYDWTLLRRLVSELKQLKTVKFSQRQYSRHAFNTDRSLKRSKEVMWAPYPRAMRFLREAMPDRVKVEFPFKL